MIFEATCGLTNTGSDRLIESMAAFCVIHRICAGFDRQLQQPIEQHRQLMLHLLRLAWIADLAQVFGQLR